LTGRVEYQTFTIGNVSYNESFCVNNISFMLKKRGTVTSFTCYVRNVDDDGHPFRTSYLASASVPGADIPAAWDWVSIDFSGENLMLHPGVQYAFSWGASGSGFTWRVYLGYDTSAATYGGGSRWVYDIFGGVGWTEYPEDDYLFNITGRPAWINWSDISNPDSTPPYCWNFNFPNGYGYYRFASQCSNDTYNETLPAANNPDAIALYTPIGISMVECSYTNVTVPAILTTTISNDAGTVTLV
jgi:hypothetical protein